MFGCSKINCCTKIHYDHFLTPDPITRTENTQKLTGGNMSPKCLVSLLTHLPLGAVLRYTNKKGLIT